MPSHSPTKRVDVGHGRSLPGQRLRAARPSALELAAHDASYEDIASKFFEHFVAIADAINTLDGTGLWDELDGFYYDHLHTNGNGMRDAYSPQAETIARRNRRSPRHAKRCRL